MAFLHTKDHKKGPGKLPRTPVSIEQKMKQKMDHAHYEMERARHDSEDWKHLSEELAHEKIELFKFNQRLHKKMLYERIGWLLLSTSLALAHLL